MKIGDWVLGELSNDASAMGFVTFMTLDSIHIQVMDSDDKDSVGKNRRVWDARKCEISSPDPLLMAEFALLRNDREDFMYWTSKLPKEVT